MDRKKAEELIEQYVDGVLPPDKTKELERCIAEDPRLQEAVNDARRVRSELSALRDDSPDEAYWRSYRARLGAELFRRSERTKRQRLVFALGAAVACAVLLGSLSVVYMLQIQQLKRTVAALGNGAARRDLASYFEPLENVRSDESVFDCLAATYPRQVEWVGWGHGQACIGLRSEPYAARQPERKLLAIETVIVRSTPDGREEVLFRPRIAALDGAEAAIDVPVTRARPGATVRMALGVRNGRVNGSVEFACTAASGRTATASTEDISLVLDEPRHVLTLNLGGVEYALLLRPTLLRDD